MPLFFHPSLFSTCNLVDTLVVLVGASFDRNTDDCSGKMAIHVPSSTFWYRKLKLVHGIGV